MTPKEFHDEISKLISAQTKSTPSEEECKAVAHHMEYNIRADRKFADNGKLKIHPEEYQKLVLSQIKNYFHANDLPRYVEQYRQYKKLQQNSFLTQNEREIIKSIALKQKKPSDFDADYLKNIYIKYFNHLVMPKIKPISLQEKNHLNYHGLWHTEQVSMIAIDIAVKENLNPLPILLAAALHDCGRTDDKHDSMHGLKGKPIAQYFLNNFVDKDLLTKEEIHQIIDAVAQHNGSSGNPKTNRVLGCLQDADCMRLFWERGAKCQTNTKSGEELKRYARHEQIKYLARLIEKVRATRPKLNLGRSNSNDGK